MGKGKLTSEAVQSLANNAKSIGGKGLESLSAVGSHGKYLGNLYRDLCSMFGTPIGSPPLDWVEIPTRAGPRTPHPIFLPHKFFQSLSANRQDVWKSRILGPAGGAKHFWDSIATSEFVVNHPFLPREQWDTIIPLGFHGDGGAFNKQESLYIFSWNSLLVHGTTMETKCLFSVIKRSEMIPETMDSLMRVFAWSCNVMLSGETPLTDYHQPPRHLNGGGVTLANGYRGCLTQVRGDWEFFVALFHFPRWDQEVMCPFCDATSEAGRPWSDCSLDAGWRDTIWTHTTYMEHLRLVGRPIPVFFPPNWWHNRPSSLQRNGRHNAHCGSGGEPPHRREYIVVFRGSVELFRWCDLRRTY